jgi:hypothetical protein
VAWELDAQEPVYRLLVQALHLDREQSTALIALLGELDGTAANLAVLYVRGLIVRQIDAGFQSFATIGALDCNELLGQQAREALARLVNRLQSVKGVDAGSIQVRNTAGQSIQFPCFASFHRSILRHGSLRVR